MEDFEDELPDEAYELLAKLLPMHPAISASGLDGKNKCYLQYALEEEFDNDIEKLLEDIQQHFKQFKMLSNKQSKKQDQKLLVLKKVLQKDT